MSESQPEQVRIIGLRPQDVTDIFKDREDQLSQLRQLLYDRTAKLICVIGRGGIGKTALVCKLCSEIESGQLLPGEAVSGAGVDGIVYIDCREENRATLERLFHDVGRLLGESAAEDLMSCWRDSSQSLADKVRFLLGKVRQGFYLLMLDNFERLLDDDHTFKDNELKTFLDLCLQAPHAMRVIATSRKRMVLQGPGIRSARMLLLESGLPESDGIALLRDLDPDGRLGLREAPERLLQEAVRRCFSLPRALESIAGILDSDPSLSLDKLLAGSDLFEGQVVENLIAEHYRHLTEPQRRVLEALAVYEAPVPAHAVSFLLKPFFPDLDTAERLHGLVRSYVVTYRRGPNVYQLHPLDQRYAYEKIPDHGQGYTKQACHRRAADFYQQMRKPKEEWYTIEDLTPQLQEFHHLERAGVYDRACSVINEIDYYYLQRWGFYRLIIQLRSRCINKLVDQALQVDNLSGRGLAHHFLGEDNQAFKCHEKALQTALEIGDREREGTQRNRLGLVFYVRGEADRAIEYFQEAAAIARELGNDRKENATLNNLGLVYFMLCEYEKAIECFERALEYARAIGSHWAEGIRLSNLGEVYYDLLDIQKASDCFNEGLSIARRAGDRKGEAIRLRSIGNIYHAFGDVDKAKECYHEALGLSRKIGHQRGKALSLTWLGRAYHHLGDNHKAIERYERALRAHRATQYRHGECMTLGDLGHAYQKLGDLEKAIDLYGDALKIARSIRSKKTISELLLGLGTIHHHLGHLADAMKCYREALSLDMPSTNYSCAIRLGLLWLEQGKKKDADKYLKRGLHLCSNLLKREPKLRETLYILALGQIASEQVKEALVTYRRALEVCSATGVVQDALDDLKLLKRIPAPVAGVQKASQLLRHTLATTKQLPEQQSEELPAAVETKETKTTPDRKEQAELKRVFGAIEESEKSKRKDSFHEIVGKSEAIREIITKIEEVRDKDVTILITGETGVGKEVVARAIASSGPRQSAPFVIANLGAIPESLIESELFGHEKGAFTGATKMKKGKFELAEGGTIFLDEIGDLKKDCQIKLFRVLQEHTIQRVGSEEDIQVNIRVIVATNKNLKEAVKDGSFRQELYYRLFIYPIQIAPLRERKEDIPVLIEYFAAHFSKEYGKQKVSFEDEAISQMLLYDWPGNIRELENCIQRAIIIAKGNIIRASDLSFADLRCKENNILSPEDTEKQMILNALRSSETVKEACVNKLKMRKSTFYDKLRKHKLGKARQYLKRSR